MFARAPFFWILLLFTFFACELKLVRSIHLKVDSLTGTNGVRTRHVWSLQQKHCITSATSQNNGTATKTGSRWQKDPQNGEPNTNAIIKLHSVLCNFCFTEFTVILRECFFFSPMTQKPLPRLKRYYSVFLEENRFWFLCIQFGSLARRSPYNGRVHVMEDETVKLKLKENERKTQFAV